MLSDFPLLQGLLILDLEQWPHSNVILVLVSLEALPELVRAFKRYLDGLVQKKIPIANVSDCIHTYLDHHKYTAVSLLYLFVSFSLVPIGDRLERNIANVTILCCQRYNAMTTH